MTEEAFIRKNSAVWKQLEDTLMQLQKKGRRKMSIKTLKKIDTLYRQVSGQLSYAQTYFPYTPTLEYLNGIVSKTHNLFHTNKKSRLSSMLDFYIHDAPALLRENAVLMAISATIFITAALFAFFHTWDAPDRAGYFIPPPMLDNLDIKDTPAVAKWDHPIMSSYIMSNNINVALMAFAYGISLGLGTAWILFQNGLLLGSLSALVMKQGSSLVYWSLILPHGIMELTAIFLSGAAGLKIGLALIDPGPLSRRDALVLKGKQSLGIIAVVIPMLIIAGIIEGFFTPSALSPQLKLAFAASTGFLILLYFTAGCRKPRPGAKG